MQHFFAPDLLESGFHALSESESHHAVHVMRLRVNDALSITNGKGAVATAQIAAITKRICLVETTGITNIPREFPCSIHIAIAPVKSMDRFEWFLEKACEWGVDSITPVIATNGERLKLNRDKCILKLIAALKQCGRAWLPELHAMSPFDAFIGSEAAAGQRYIATCNAVEKVLLPGAIQPGKDMKILIGPEGDFTKIELQHAISNNWKPVTLGEYRLRTETAALEALVQYNMINRM